MNDKEIRSAVRWLENIKTETNDAWNSRASLLNLATLYLNASEFPKERAVQSVSKCPYCNKIIIYINGELQDSD